ncbi:MAG: hypothetical protein ABI597_00590 [Gammaproteobacteria bacterium]
MATARSSKDYDEKSESKASVSIDDLIYGKDARFYNIAKNDRANEHIDFLLAVRNLEGLSESEKMKSKNDIYEFFIALDGDKSLNLDGTKIDILRNKEEIGTQDWDAALVEQVVFSKEMLRDVFNKFNEQVQDEQAYAQIRKDVETLIDRSLREHRFIDSLLHPKLEGSRASIQADAKKEFSSKRSTQEIVVEFLVKNILATRPPSPSHSPAASPRSSSQRPSSPRKPVPNYKPTDWGKLHHDILGKIPEKFREGFVEAIIAGCGAKGVVVTVNSLLSEDIKPLAKELREKGTADTFTNTKK